MRRHISCDYFDKIFCRSLCLYLFHSLFFLLLPLNEMVVKLNSNTFSSTTMKRKSYFFNYKPVLLSLNSNLLIFIY